MNCKTCGAVPEEGSGFCSACGAAADAQDARRRPRKRLLIAGIALAALLVTALVLTLVLTRGKKEGEPQRSLRQTAEGFADAWVERDLLGCDEFLAYPVQDAMLEVYRANGDFGSVHDSRAQRENTLRRIEDLHERTRQQMAKEYGEDFSVASETLSEHEFSGEEIQEKLQYYSQSKLSEQIRLPDWVDLSSVSRMLILRVQTTVSGNGRTHVEENTLCLVLLDGQWYVLW